MAEEDELDIPDEDGSEPLDGDETTSEDEQGVGP